MSYVFVKASSQKVVKTAPTGFAVVANWSLLFRYKPGTMDTSNGNGIFNLGPAAASGTRGFILRNKGDKTINYFDGGTNLGGSAVLVNGTDYPIMVTRSGTTIAIYVNSTTADSSGYGGTPPNELNGTTDVIQLSTNDPPTTGVSFLDGSVSFACWVQGVTITGAAGMNYLNQTGGKTICSLITDYGTSGGITANALKMMWPLGNTNPFTDLSGVGNDGTQTNNPTNAAQLDSFGETCALTTLFRSRTLSAVGTRAGSRQVA